MNLKDMLLTTDTNYLKRYVNNTTTLPLSTYNNISTSYISHNMGLVPFNYEIFADVSKDGVWWVGGEKVAPDTDYNILNGSSLDATFLTIDSYILSDKLYFYTRNNTAYPGTSGSISIEYVVYI